MVILVGGYKCAHIIACVLVGSVRPRQGKLDKS